MKNIRLKNVVPLTLKDRISATSQIWNKELSFEQDTFYVIKAVSGSGKSTFINSLYGIRKDYEGSIFYDQDSISELNNDALSDFRKNHISIVFQDLRLFGQLTGLENILIKSKEKILSPKQIEWTEILKIDKLLDRPCDTLSYGERQRVAIVRALSQPFAFLLLDEPFSHLDIENGQNAYQIICKEAKEQNASIILTSLGNENYLEADKTLVL